MLAAICVRRGRLPRQYAAIYQEFRNDVARAVKSLEATDQRIAGGLGDFLEDWYYFNLAQRWLDAMEATGNPDRVAAIVDDQMMSWRAFSDPSLRKLRKDLLQIVGSVAVAFLDGLLAHGKEPVLVLVAAHESPFHWQSGISKMQWDIYPSATCLLRAEHRGDSDSEARVSVVPRLWVDTLSDAAEPSMGGEFVVLAYELDHRHRRPEVCSAAAAAIGRSCDAGVLSCRRWAAGVPTRLAYERAAREAAASALARRGLGAT